MRYFTLGRRLPKSISTPLFGDRERHGYVPDVADPSWQVWRKLDEEFYDQNQRQSIGAVVNGMGYRVMKRIDLHGLHVLEIGPGALDHIAYWRNTPARFMAADIRPEFLERTERRLREHNVPFQAVSVDNEKPASLALPDASVDVVLSFYSLEHLYPLADYLREIHRVLKPGGRLVGAIPCEGGLAWGMGRFLTTRRWLKAHGCLEPDKVICWEHPNFADGVLNYLSQHFDREMVSFWPFPVSVVDLNLVTRFIWRRH